MAALLMAGGKGLPRRVLDGASLAVSLIVLAAGLRMAAGESEVYWFGGWEPRVGWVPGIDFTVDPASAGAIAMAGLLASAAFMFSWRYFESPGPLFHSLMLIFVGAMSGFALAGDLFNLFVWFELMGVCAYALTAFKIEEEGPVQGALNFAVTNSVAAFLILTGIGLLYGRTGSLNMAEVGETLAAVGPDPLVRCALGLIVAGLLVKSAILPFHFWLPDAHAVAPAPVSCLFSGLMVEVGLFALARVYWTVFSGAFPEPDSGFRSVLLALGALTAVTGAVMCCLQRHVKRLLAFSTVSHMGVGLMGVALLSSTGLAATGLYLAGHGMLKGALFLAAGILLHRTGEIDEYRLHRPGLGPGLAFLIGGLALADLPPFALFHGKEALDGAAEAAGFAFVAPLGALASGLTGGAVLRVWGRVYRGWGDGDGLSRAAPADVREERETRGTGRTPVSMAGPVLLLMLGSLLLGLFPPHHRLGEGAARMLDRPLYVREVLRTGGGPPPAEAHLARPKHPGLWAGVALALALGTAAWSLAGPRPPKAAAALADRLHDLHSGHVGDYVAWLTLGAGILCACAMVAV